MLVLCLTVPGLHSQERGQWLPARRPDWTFSMDRVVFWDAQKGFIKGNHSELLITENGGQTWREHPWPDSVITALAGFWDDLHMTPQKDIWLVGEGAAVKLPYGGESWEFHDLSFLNDPYSGFYTIWFVDQQHGWLGSYRGEVYRTVDGGQAWERTFNFRDIIGETILWDISFTDSLTGFALLRTGMGLSRGYRTNDGGYTWTIISNPDVHGRRMSFFDQQHGWILGEFDKVFITTDGGNTWQTALTHAGDKRQNSVFFLNETKGWICGDAGLMLSSEDGGLTWHKLTSPTYNDVRDMFFIDENRGWVGARWGTIAATEDGGQTWQWQVAAPSNHLKSVFFLDENTGFAVGNHNYVHTKDGGQTWVHTDSLNCHAIQFVDDQHGWLASYDAVYATNDGGETWHKQFAYDKINRMFFVDLDYGWVVSTYSTKTVLHRTINGGLSWEKLPEIVNEDLYAMEFVSPLEGWLVGGDGIIRHTTDGGETWELQHQGQPGLSDGLLDVDFVDNQYGWVVGFSGQILHTNDGGKTWILQRRTNYLDDQYYGVHFLDRNEGWVVGLVGIILHTTDGGQTWDDSYGDPNYVGTWWRDVHFTDSEHGWVVGLYGYVDKFLGPNALSVSSPQVTVPEEILLFSSRPNPMREQTFITYELPFRTSVRVEIYDILGRHVRTLLEREQRPGSYTVSWDGRDKNGALVASGTYLYHLRAGKLFRTKRLAVVR